MKNYTKEINELEMKLKRLRAETRQMENDKILMVELYGDFIYGDYENSDDKYLIQISLRSKACYYELLKKMELYEELINEAKLKLNRLKREWRAVNKREYYCPMDDIDIVISIKTNGYISGRLL